MSLCSVKNTDPQFSHVPGRQLVPGQRVLLQHIAREDWTMLATVDSLCKTPWIVNVQPDEWLDSPANWVISTKEPTDV